MSRHATVAFLTLAALFAGCSTQRAGREVASAVTGMGGAQATGAGGSTMTAPPAAAEPSEQHATEETYYAQPPATVAPTTPAESDPLPVVEFRAPYDVPAQPAAVATPAPIPQAQPLYRKVETHTRLGAQQEVAPMLKQAGEIFGRLNKAHWLGILAVLVGFGGVLHSAGNKDTGYPLCWLKVMGGGVLAITMGDALWFWVLGALAALLYAGQKFGIIRGLPLP